MTREEAARVLESMRVDYTFHKINSAIDLAIAALRENPCDNCVGPGLAIAHGYKDMRTKKPEVE